MKVLVTGGTGVVGTAAVRHLLGRGHTVRLFSRHAADDSEQFPRDVEAVDGSVNDEASVRRCADGCDVVLHIAGILEGDLEKVNVAGTRNMVQEAERAGVPRFIYVSSLGADRGTSAYHQSKRRAELETQKFSGSWLVIRPANVYGAGDEVVSTLLVMVRTLPVIPVLGGDHVFQPIAADDVGEALAITVEREDLRDTTIDLAGLETTSMTELLDIFERITGKSPARVPLPTWLASAGTQVASKVGIDLPINADQITMMVEENVLPAGQPNALVDTFGITPTRLADGLAMLADSLPEQLPSEGVGRLFRRRYWVDLYDTGLTPEALFDRFRSTFAIIAPSGMMDVGAEPGSSRALVAGETITMALPFRGNVQVRVEEATLRSATVCTLLGHPLAGAVRFLAEEHGKGVRFQVQTYDRASGALDLIAISTIGRFLKARTWTKVVESLASEAGGEAPEAVKNETEVLDDERSKRIEDWIQSLVVARKREENAQAAAAG